MWRIKYSFISILISSACVNAFALDNAHTPVHHPIIIKTPTPESVKLPLGLSPQEIKKAYGIDQLKRQGEGQIIAIIVSSDDPNIESDLAVFNSTFGLPACQPGSCFTKIYATGTKPDTDNYWAGEIALDVEWAHAIAPLAKIYLVEAKKLALPADMDQAIGLAVKLGANIVSMSFGGEETSTELARDAQFKNPNVIFVASSGDYGHHISYPSASPYVVSVGGSTLTTDVTGKYVSETAWPGSGGGVSQFEPLPDYQKNYPIPNNPMQKRGVPDIAYNAGMAIPVYNTIPDPDKGLTGWFAVGGTSAGAPQVAGIFAIANSIKGSQVIGVNSLLYKIAGSKYNMTYHDIVTGQNGTCGYYCEARVGYDYVTGLGTPHAKGLTRALANNGIVIAE